MAVQVCSLRKSLLAYFTVVRLLDQRRGNQRDTNALVVVEVRPLGKALLAHPARVWLEARVDPLVDVQVGLLGKRLLTVRALERFQTGVSAFMNVQVRALGEGFFTH